MDTITCSGRHFVRIENSTDKCPVCRQAIKDAKKRELAMSKSFCIIFVQIIPHTVFKIYVYFKFTFQNRISIIIHLYSNLDNILSKIHIIIAIILWFHESNTFFCNPIKVTVRSIKREKFLSLAI